MGQFWVGQKIPKTIPFSKCTCIHLSVYCWLYQIYPSAQYYYPVDPTAIMMVILYLNYAEPGTKIKINCSVGNPNSQNQLTWSILLFDGPKDGFGDGIRVTNTNGANADDTENGIEFKSTVSYFNTTERTTNATLSFTAVTGLDTLVLSCSNGDFPAVKSDCTLFILSKLCTY